LNDVQHKIEQNIESEIESQNVKIGPFIPSEKEQEKETESEYDQFERKSINIKKHIQFHQLIFLVEEHTINH